jgi:hypothetical protein
VPKTATKPTATGWENRIVGYGEENPEQLLANPKNFRRHPKHQQEALGGALDTLGWIQDVLVNQTTGHVIDGHLRVELAMRHNQPTVPVKYVQLTPEEEDLALATLDPISALAITDKKQLEELLADIGDVSNEGLAALLDDLQQLADDLHSPPDLDSLANSHPVPDDKSFWPEVRVQVSPGTLEQYTQLIADYPGDTDGDRFARLVDDARAYLSSGG